ncbi:MAG: SDR family oxidoreductase [Candidatus Diapherotrites archaeon]|nr:SDR family oxidoreductase [Candidatus Diapherotrites archaeon]
MLEGKTAVVTGAGSGLGKAIALGLPFAGVKVGVLDINAKAVFEVAERINAEFEGFAFPMIASVSDEGQLQTAYAGFVKAFEKIDILVNCAGIARLAAVNELSAKDIKLANDVNIDGYFLNAKIASEFMIKEKCGEIINISSASARGASENSSLYGVAKETQCMMARSWAMDLGKHNIRVNAILAGDLFGDENFGIDSGIWNKDYFEKKAVDKGLVKAGDKRISGEKLHPEVREMVIQHYCKRTALGKQIEYADVLNLIAFLSSGLGSKITGESIAITSGNPSAFSR